MIHIVFVLLETHLKGLCVAEKNITCLLFREEENNGVSGGVTVLPVNLLFTTVHTLVILCKHGRMIRIFTQRVLV